MAVGVQVWFGVFIAKLKKELERQIVAYDLTPFGGDHTGKVALEYVMPAGPRDASNECEVTLFVYCEGGVTVRVADKVNIRILPGLMTYDYASLAKGLLDDLFDRMLSENHTAIPIRKMIERQKYIREVL